MGGEKTGEEEQKASKGTSFDINDFTIIKEGEAEILMHTKNAVFYNKAQVLIFLICNCYVLIIS